MRTRTSFNPIQHGFDIQKMQQVTRGFSIKSSRPPNIIEPPFEIPPTPNFSDVSDKFGQAINQCLSNESINYNVQNINKISRSLSLSDEQNCKEAYDFISSHIVEFAHGIPEHVSEISTASEIGDFWNLTKSKLNIAILSFSPLCKKGLPTFDRVFHNALFEAYNGHKDLYVKASHLIIDAYNESRETNSSNTLNEQFSFLIATGLFESHFMPLLISSVIDYIKPIIKDSLDAGIVEYLQTAQHLSESEEKLAEQVLPPKAIKKLTSSINTTLFTDNLASFVAIHLNDLVTQNDSQSISICARLSSVTNTASKFTKQLAHVFQEEVSKAFELPDPISKILELYNALSAFVDAAFGTNSARVLKEGFEKGFKVDDENTAKMIEVAIHRDFPRGVDITPYVGLFKMLRCKDIFQSYHSLYLNRRALECTPDQLVDDRKFAERLKESCGSKYTEPLYQTFDDYDQSLELNEKFFNNYKEQFASTRNIFSPFIFSRESWPTIELKPIKVPQNIQEIMTCYEQFTETETKKKIKWSMQLSRIDLQATGFEGVTSVSCNANFAVVLLAISNGARSIPDIINQTLLEEKDVTAALTKFSSKKVGKLIDKINICFNPEASVEGGVIDVFSIVTQAEAASSAAPETHDNQIDAACMKVLKNENSMEKDNLYNEILNIIPKHFKITRTEFENRLPKLENRQFIKIDPSGRVHYKP